MTLEEDKYWLSQRPVIMMSTVSPRTKLTHQKISEHIWISRVGLDQAGALYHMATVALSCYQKPHQMMTERGSWVACGLSYPWPQPSPRLQTLLPFMSEWNFTGAIVILDLANPSTRETKWPKSKNKSWHDFQKYRSSEDQRINASACLSWRWNHCLHTQPENMSEQLFPEPNTHTPKYRIAYEILVIFNVF